jgi:hypothetical protein
MEVEGLHEEERRVAARRSISERRFGERRAPERATVGRRVLFVPDRRLEFRRAFDRRAIELA